MKFIIRKFNRLFHYISQGVFIKYLLLKILPGYNVIDKHDDKILIRTKFESIIYELPFSEPGYLYAANPKVELLLSSFLNLTEGTFIDVGAFIGRHAIRVARNKNVRVIAVEPNPISVELIKKNCLLNNVQNNIEIIQAALVDDDKIIDISLQLDFDRSKLITNNYTSDDKLVKVKAISFNKLLQNYNVDTENQILIKIDIEGYEEKVLKSMKEFLLKSTNNFKMVCEILHNSPKKNEMIEYVKSLGFNIQQVDSENFYIYKN